MAATERITMTMRELDRFKVIQEVADGKLKPWRAPRYLRQAAHPLFRFETRDRLQQRGHEQVELLEVFFRPAGAHRSVDLCVANPPICSSSAMINRGTFRSAATFQLDSSVLVAISLTSRNRSRSSPASHRGGCPFPLHVCPVFGFQYFGGALFLATFLLL
nr:hypothetical protein [Burkholderia ubonensis]